MRICFALPAVERQEQKSGYVKLCNYERGCLMEATIFKHASEKLKNSIGETKQRERGMYAFIRSFCAPDTDPTS